MGKPASTHADIAQRYRVDTFTSATAGGWIELFGPFNLDIAGTFVGTLVLERSFDGGVTAANCTKPDGTANSFTGPVSMVVPHNPEAGVLYRLRATAWTSGTAVGRLSQ